MGSHFRTIPAVHRLLEEGSLREAVADFGRDQVVAACRAETELLRQAIADEKLTDASVADECNDLPRRILAQLRETSREAYVRIINATGILIHTNLGRAPLPYPFPASLESYLALEYDVMAGSRGQRLAPLRERLCTLVGSESAVMVNNNAAALVLLLTTHAAGRQVIVSRSELIEIGGSFRLPMVMEASGAQLVEVGCTNRTHLKDYEDAITQDTAALLVAHQSNFKIVGFTASPPISELASLAHRYNLPLFVDQGSGCIHDLSRWGLPHEDTVSELLGAGSDVVCFSGDKLLGGPQAGILVGTGNWIEPLGKHPLYRALRPDKTALVTMDRTIAAHHSGQLESIPLYAMLETSLETLKRRAQSVGRRLRQQGVPARGCSTRAALGGGTTPTETISSYGLAIAGNQELADNLRRSDPSVVGRFENEELVLDLRTVLPGQDKELVSATCRAYGAPQSRQAGGK
ncbi:MAG: L-seryl-tRNA(Sec) selenium transferase [bacterium]|nr:L-seryl-tRNA(Sec) selenium transferase [bacterium]